MGALSLEEFCDYLAGKLGRPAGSLAPDADIRADLQLDSLEMFILLLGVDVPEALLPHVLTLQDAFAQYMNTAGRQV
jgi:hypothetical protein